MTTSLARQPLYRGGPLVSRLGYGAFKIGRNQGIKYKQQYAVPSESETAELLEGLRKQGVNYFDTAPAYGISEERLGRLLPPSDEIVISTKVGETFEEGVSKYDYSATAVRRSLDRSRARLRRNVLDAVFVHSNGDDVPIIHELDVVPVLLEERRAGRIRAVGFSGKTVAGANAALPWADVLMVEYHREDTSHREVMSQAAARGIGVVIKKGLASGKLPAREAIRFVLSHPTVCSLAIGGLNLDHWGQNIAAALQIREAA